MNAKNSYKLFFLAKSQNTSFIFHSTLFIFDEAKKFLFSLIEKFIFQIKKGKFFFIFKN